MVDAAAAVGEIPVVIISLRVGRALNPSAYTCNEFVFLAASHSLLLRHIAGRILARGEIRYPHWSCP